MKFNNVTKLPINLNLVLLKTVRYSNNNLYLDELPEPDNVSIASASATPSSCTHGNRFFGPEFTIDQLRTIGNKTNE